MLSIETIKNFSVLVGAIIAVITLGKAIAELFKKYRLKHPSTRKQIDRIFELVKKSDDDNADFRRAMIRAQLEDFYTIYVVRMGCCPLHTKSAITALFDYYTSQGWNHLASDYKSKIESLPEVEQAERN